MRTRMVTRYVEDRLARRGGAGKESPRSLRRHEHENRLRAAEVMRAGNDLVALCNATGETAACAVLATWDGRSTRRSVGTHIFEEFLERAPAASLWEVPFDAADPFNTPRDLAETDADVRAAMKAAIEHLRSRGVPMDARWGSLQVAGDRGAKPIPLGGGMGDAAGNANALASRNPVQNADHYKPITYGSSHIQAIAFKDRGKVQARTILTYGQYENPRSRWSQDQTRLFSRGRWVKFPFTTSEITKRLVRTITLQGS
jgi:acyl-homoserine-lactone acylase